MRIGVVGVGGAAGYFGGRLAEAKLDVHFVARPGAHLEAMHATGLQVKSIEGDFSVSPVRATSMPAEVGPVDVVILGVKDWQVPQALESSRPMIGPHTVVLPLQNGIETPAVVARVLGREHALSGYSRIISFRSRPGEITHTGAKPLVVFGELEPGPPTARVLRLGEVLRAARGMEVRTPDDVTVEMWQKLLFIASWGGVGAITRSPVGVIRETQATRGLITSMAREALAVARASGVTLQESCIDETMARIDGLPVDGTTSMQRDIVEGRPSELDGLCGSIVRLGRALAVPTPVTSMIYAALLPQEERARARAGA